jgi:hypothetical protein
MDEQKEVTVESQAGVPEGTVLDNGEKVVGSYDENGTLVGWHKEPGSEE